jgi:hypothetical protein
MQKSEDAATPMQVNSNDITVLFPAEISLPDIRQLSVMEPFTEEGYRFL